MLLSIPTLWAPSFWGGFAGPALESEEALLAAALESGVGLSGEGVPSGAWGVLGEMVKILAAFL